MSAVNIEVVEGTTYTTVKQHFAKGQVYSVSHTEWAKLQGEKHPVTGKPVFALCDKAATMEVADSMEDKSVVRTGQITITHAPQSNAMSREEAEKAGLGGFFRDGPKSIDTDTGASMAGTGGESEAYEGPSGHEGLDDEDEVLVGGSAPAATHAAPEPAQAVQKAAVVGKPKGVKINRPGPRNADKKEALGLPKAVVPLNPADIEQV